MGDAMILHDRDGEGAIVMPGWVSGSTIVSQQPPLELRDEESWADGVLHAMRGPPL